MFFLLLSNPFNCLCILLYCCQYISNLKKFYLISGLGAERESVFVDKHSTLIMTVSSDRLIPTPYSLDETLRIQLNASYRDHTIEVIV